ncbi:Ff.00g037120.m01.CDS01 [Fusarium sp. VM40]|nr:Ff.00g037120.m01.CDS01 [Fusarium sp. VM40]
MSMNPESATPQQGEFSSKVAPSKPLTTKGHAPGVLVGIDAAPEFHVQQLPSGTAPPEHTFQPNPENEIPAQAPGAEGEAPASATLGGATSADLHGRGKKERSGLEGVGANASDPIHDKGADRDHPTNYRGKGGENAVDYPGAAEREPAKAEEVASERA